MKKLLSIPNILTAVRIAGAVCLLFAMPLSVFFYAVYTVSGVSDALDGFTARLTKSTSEFGAKLDSAADLIFYAVMLLKILPLLISMLPGQIWYCVAAVCAIRLCSYILALVKFHRFSALHTFLNKLTGLMLFFVPYLMETRAITGYCIAVCVASGLSSLEELFIHIISKDYNPERKSIFLIPLGKKKRILETARLFLRPWRESDAESLYEYAKDSEVGPIAGWQPHKSPEESRDIIKNVLSSDETYAVTRKTDDKAIGCVDLMIGKRSNIGLPEDEGEIGYWLGAPFWGQGIIPEAVLELLRHGFEDLRLSKIWCGYFDGNTKSRRVQEKCGFVYHHTIPEVFRKQLGKVFIEHVSCITRSQWMERIR